MPQTPEQPDREHRIAYGKSELAVPLEQLACQSPDEATCEAVADWHYWLARGYGY